MRCPRILLLLLLFCAPAASRAELLAGGEIEVTVEHEPTYRGTHGYIEFQVRIVNRSAKSPRPVEIRLPITGYQSESREVTKSLVVQPSTTVVVPIFQPNHRSYGDGLGVRVEGYQEASVPLQIPAYNHRDSGRLALVSPKVSASFLGGAQNGELEIQEQASTTWSTSWLGYTSYDGAVIHVEELEILAQPIRDALLQWVEAGGNLLILGAWEPTPGVRLFEEHQQLKIYESGFGRILVHPEVDSWAFSAHWTRVQEEWRRTNVPFNLNLDVEASNQQFPIVENVSIPRGEMLLLMIGLSLLIGPLNYRFVSRRGRPILLLLTVPLVSLLACLGLLTFSLAAEGWTSRTRALTYTLLDEETHRATTLGWVAYYAPMGAGDGLHFSPETELHLLTRNDWKTENQPRIIDWTTDQHLKEGWMASRIPAHFQVRKSEIRRERLVLRDVQNGSPQVTNGLGAPIRDLWFADWNGQVYHAANLAAGAEAKLLPTKEQTVIPANRTDPRRIFEDHWMTGLQSAQINPVPLLQPGSYLALVEGSPFLEAGLQGALEEKSVSLVFGTSKGLSDES